MPRSASPRETEIKLQMASARSARRLLLQAGFVIQIRRVFEVNIIFDTPDNALRRKNNLLRLRQAGRRAIFTFKGATQPSRYKSRDEIESDVADPQALTTILAGLGYQAVFRYEKFRTVYHKPNRPGSVMLDETPIGDYLELEGSPAWIDRTARALGRSPADYITASYGALYLADCQAKGVEPHHMVFGRGRRRFVRRQLL